MHKSRPFHEIWGSAFFVDVPCKDYYNLATIWGSEVDRLWHNTVTKRPPTQTYVLELN